MEELLISLEIVKGLNILYILCISLIVSFILDRLHLYIENVKKQHIPLLNLLVSGIIVLLITTFSTYGYDFIKNLIKLKNGKNKEVDEQLKDLLKDGEDDKK